MNCGREPKNKLNLIGEKYGRLTVLERVERPESKWQTFYSCQCECGSPPIIVSTSNLRKGNTSSCGCLQREITSLVKTKHHAETLYPGEYNSWLDMRGRCSNCNHKEYERYGGRGIIYDPIFEDFLVFLAEVGEKPEQTRYWSLGRIDNEKNYEPGNIEWQDPKTQANNTRRNVNITYKGKTQSVAMWAEELGVTASMIHTRLKRGSFPQAALSLEKKTPRELTINGTTKSLADFCRDYNIEQYVVNSRLKRGWEPELALTTPVKGSKGSLS